MSAYENVEFGFRIAGAPMKNNRETVERSLERVGMKERIRNTGQRNFPGGNNNV